MGMEFEGRAEAEAKTPAVVAKRGITPAGTANVDAAKAEALGEGVEFDFDGEHYELPAAMDWDIDVFEYATNGDILNAVRALLGEDQWELFRSEDDGKGGRKKKRRSLRDLTALWEQAEAATGVQPGESRS